MPMPEPSTKTYRVVAEATISLSCQVEASSPEAALLLADECSMPHITDHTHGFRGQDSQEGSWSTSGEIDGAATNLEVQDA